MKVGDLVETDEFGIGLVLEVVFDHCRILYSSGRWYWACIDQVGVFNESR